MKRELFKCERCGIWSLNSPYCSAVCKDLKMVENYRRKTNEIRDIACVYCKKLFESYKFEEYSKKSRGLPIVCSEKCEERFFIMNKQENPNKKIKKEKKAQPTKAEMWLARKERKPNDIHLGDKIKFGSTFGKSCLDSATRKRMWL